MAVPGDASENARRGFESEEGEAVLQEGEAVPRECVSARLARPEILGGRCGANPYHEIPGGL